MLEGVTEIVRGVELLIILDQFEEYFVYHSADEGIGEFDDELSRAVVNLDLRANFLISIREDWLARLDRFKGRIPNLFDNSIRIEHLERATAREAISKPIAKYNELIRKYGNGRQTEAVIETEFIFRALNQLERLDEPDESTLERPVPLSEAKPAERRIHAARLQVVLQHLWDKVKDNSPPILGAGLLENPDTARRIIQSHLHQSLDHLSRKEKMIAANAFRFLVTESGTKFASTAEGLSARCGRPLDEIRDLLTKLSARDVRVLNQVAPSPGQLNQLRYELTSDVLAAPILDWVKDIRAKQRRRDARDRRILYFFVFLIIAIISGAFLRARQQRRAATERQEVVEKARREAELMRARAERVLDVVRKQDERVKYSKAVLRGHGDNVTSAIFTGNGHVLTSSADGSAILWDIESKSSVREYSKDEKGLVCAAASPKGDFVLTASTDGGVTLWNVATGASKQLRERVGKHITGLLFSPGGDFIVAANTAGEIIVWNASTGDRIKEMPGNGEAIRQVAYSHSGTFLAAASEDHTVHVWRTSDWSVAGVLRGHTEKVNGLAFSPKNEEVLATAGADTTVRVWNISTGSSRVFKDTKGTKGHTASINSVAFDREGRHLLTASDDTTALVWNVETGKSIQLIGHTDKVLSASFSPNGLQVITGSKDNTARIWSASTGKLLIELRGHLDQVTYVSFSSDGKFALTASDDATARVWEPQAGNFEVDQPTIDAIPTYYTGPCPVTISFLAKITAISGGGTVVYRFRGSDGRIWPLRNLTFDKPGFKYVNWYWRITEDYTGSEGIEVVEPKGIKEKKAKFIVKCNKSESDATEPAPTGTP
jgi:WD40 repeat protein